MSLDTSWHEYIVSGTVLAAWVFSLVGGYSVDNAGRRRTILVAAVVFGAGSLGMALAPTKELLLVGRLVVGMGVGLASVSTPVYLAETSAPAVRGQVVTTFQVGVTFGQLAASIVCGLLSATAGGWRWMLGLAGVPSAVLLVGALLLPESPRWLVAQGRLEEAVCVLRVLRGAARAGDDDDQVEANVQRELQDMKESDMEHNKADPGGSTVVRVLRTRSARCPLLIASMLASVQQLAGVNTVMYYSASIIQMAGVGALGAAIWLSVLVALANFAFSVVGVFLIERVGRRPLLLGSLGGVVMALVLLAAGFLVMDLTSPLVTEVLTDTLSPDLCTAAARCSDCVSSSLGCGFCYSSNASTPTTCRSLGNVPDAEACSGDGDVTRAVGWCPSGYSWIAVAALVLYLVMFSPGLGPVPWAVNSEIHPTWARGVSGGVAASCHWGFNLLVSLTFLTLVENLTAKGAFLVYAALGVAGWLLIYAVLPETRGIRLEDMEALFRDEAGGEPMPRGCVGGEPGGAAAAPSLT
ncbi:hypothetical protein ONE63_010300 [Megalurothrips usitatus]|uniref:Major facilitator superfamily (MFS) profile domain-containing protein n=1 Tax=Megalurothrips usitatus TaxID=439358 RepID=A0AAV7XHE8_9NEOP|nr:hypothetical protein ONE63_010300 [Megalurothrips usitatus]